MKLLTSVLSIQLSGRVSAQMLMTLLVVATILGLEVVGRLLTCDLQDLVSLVTLIGLIGMVAGYHRRRHLAWVDGLITASTRIGKWFRYWKYEHGVDFRGSPPYPRRLPGVIWWLGVALVAWGVLAVVVWNLVPGGWRDIGTHSSYVVYVLGMGVIWSLVMLCLLAGLFVPMQMINRRLRDALTDRAQRGIVYVVVFAASMSYLVAVVAAATFLPVAAALVVCAMAMVVAMVCFLLPSHAEVAILWRASPESRIYAVPVHRLFSGGVIFLLLLFVSLILTTTGNHLVSSIDPMDRMPITNSLGSLAAWTAPGLLFLLGIRAWYGRRSDPARRTAPTMRISGSDLTQDVWQSAAEVVRRWGWHTRSITERARVGEGDIRAELVSVEKSEATEFDPIWPLKVSLADLEQGDVRERFARRDELQVRQHFFRRLKRLFRKAMADRGTRGGGYWFAPQWWFIDTLGREEGGRKKRTEDGAGRMRQSGPSYEESFGRRVRQYLHQVLRAVQIDVIYIEDGVKIRSLTRIFRNLLELYDIHGGRRIVDDHTFQGIPGVRVTVHELSPEKPLIQTAYKQPRFDELSRGRVLHIFRDRGDHEEVSEEPLDHSWEPAPVMFGS